MLAVQQLSSLLFNSEEGNQLVSMVNNSLKKLIQNDTSLVSDNTYAPGIWECRWVNDSSKSGYSKGDAVWMNTQTPYDILNYAYDTVMQKIQSNTRLASMYAQINAENQAVVNAFMIKCIEGKASSSVSALYCLGDVSLPVQIRVSTSDNNKAYPTDDKYWKDFFFRSDYSTNSQLLSNELYDALSIANQQHLNDYHISSLTYETLDQMGFVKKNAFTSTIQMQNFYDHIACENMNGFDYVVEFKQFSDYNGSSWYRKWRSGYLEQGGFINNNGRTLLEIVFKVPFNYSIGQGFQQSGYETLNVGSNTIDNVKNDIASNNRYVMNVTPISKNEAELPYPKNIVDANGSKLYATTDITKMSNAGFSIVNVDSTMSLYSKYCWNVSGYTVVA